MGEKASDRSGQAIVEVLALSGVRHCRQMWWVELSLSWHVGGSMRLALALVSAFSVKRAVAVVAPISIGTSDFGSRDAVRVS